MLLRSDWIVRFGLSLIFLLILNVIIYTQTSVNSISQLRALSSGSSTQVTVQGYYTSGDGGGGVFVWNANSTAADNGGTVVRPGSNPTQGRWIRDTSEFDYYNVKWFGARGRDNAADNDHLSKQRTIDAARDAKVLRVYIPKGIYQVSATAITIDQTHNGTEIFGDPLVLTTDTQGRPIVDESQSTVIKRAAVNGSFSLISVTKDPDPLLENINFRNLAVNGNRDSLSGEGNGGHGITLYRRGDGGTSSFRPVNNILLENVWSYKNRRGTESEGNGIINAFESVTLLNIGVHNNGLHGVTAMAESRNTVYDGVISYKNGYDDPVGFYGVDLARGENKVLRNFEIYENARGIKTPGVKGVEIINGVIRDNVRDGFTTGGGGEGLGENLVIDNVTAFGNGHGGFRFGDDWSGIHIGKVIAYNNGLDMGTDWPNIIVFVPAAFDEIVSYNYYGEASYSVSLRNDITVNKLTVYNNNTAGVEIAGDVIINSGEIYNNHRNGIYINGNHQVHLRNIKFGNSNESSPHRQTYSDIRCTGEGTLIHSGLDFSNSKVSPENRIRVNTVKLTD